MHVLCIYHCICLPVCTYTVCLTSFRTGMCFRSHICTIQSDMHGYTLTIPLLYHRMCLLHPIPSISVVFTSYMAYITIQSVLYASKCPSRHVSRRYISVYLIYHMLYHAILAYQNAIPLYTNRYRLCARIARHTPSCTTPPAQHNHSSKRCPHRLHLIMTDNNEVDNYRQS